MRHGVWVASSAAQPLCATSHEWVVRLIPAHASPAPLQVVDSGYHTQRYGEQSRQRLDIAILGFFQNFRKVYVGEQVMHASKVRRRASSGTRARF